MMQFDQIRWFTGVVEDREDPVKAGRVKVRIFGFNTQDKGKLPTDDLIWAQVATSVHSASVDGVGVTPSDLLVGSWVFGIFMDGKSSQIPLILSSFMGMTPAHPDVNKLARNEDVTPHTALSGIPTESGGSAVEHAPTYDAKYPYNRVKETESGHIIEIDDTPGKERIREMHRTETFYEVHPNGDKTTRVVGAEDHHVEKDSLHHIMGDSTVTVRKGANVLINSEAGNGCRIRVGNNGSMHITIDNGNMNVEVNGNMTVHTTANTTLNVDGNLSATVGGSATATIGGSATIKCGGSMVEQVGGSVTRTIGGSVTETIGGSFTRATAGSMSMVSGGSTSINAPNVRIG